MCMEDYRIGRETYSYEDSAVIGTTPTLLVPADPDRVCLILSIPPSGNIHYSTNPLFTTTMGIRLTTNSFVLVLNIQDHGDLVRKAWYAAHSIGSVTVGYVASALTKR